MTPIKNRKMELDFDDLLQFLAKNLYNKKMYSFAKSFRTHMMHAGVGIIEIVILILVRQQLTYFPT